MPTKRFYNLPEDKKQAIREAAVDEFIRVPFEKASINQIILNAGISRGSFYTYFEDKRDVLCYIYQDSANRLRERCEEGLAENGGDLWKVMEDVLSFAMENAVKGKLFQLSHNVIMYQDFEHVFTGGCGPMGAVQEEAVLEMVRVIYERTDRTHFRINSLENFRLLLEVIMASMMMALAKFYQNPDHAENIKKLFHKKLEIVKFGVYKQAI